MKIEIHSDILTVDSFRQRLKDLGITPNHSLLLACSGGIDSMCLADLLIKSGYTFSVAHVNYGLRGQESKEDMEFVQLFCKQRKLPVYVLNAHEQIKVGGNIQEQAREIRYSWFHELLSNHDIDFILTAHHMNDQAETIMLNLIRGTGLKGLAGMQHSNEKIIRPLLPYSKSAILNYCIEYDIPYRDDSSNAELKYTRNKIRHKVLPLLSEINPKAIEHIAQVGQNISFSRYALNQLLENLNKKHRSIKHTGEVEYDFTDFAELGYLADYLFYELHGYGFNYEQIKNLCGELPFVSGKTVYANSYQLITQKNKVYLVQSQNMLPSSVRVNVFPFHYITHSFSLEIEIMKVSSIHSFQEENTLFILADGFIDTEADIVIDYWKEGDIFQPMGMHGTKKLSDYFTDKKIPVHMRITTPLIRVNDTIAAIIPFTIHELFRVSENAQSLMRIRYKTQKAVE